MEAAFEMRRKALEENDSDDDDDDDDDANNWSDDNWHAMEWKVEVSVRSPGQFLHIVQLLFLPVLNSF